MKEIKKMRKEEFKKLNDGTAFWKTGYHVIISCNYIQTWEQLAEALGNAFQFPMRNEGFDGTWDWLTDLSWLGKQPRISIYFYESEKLLKGDRKLKEEVLNLINKYVKAEKKEEVDKVNEGVKAVKTDIALLKVTEAKTNATVINALKELSNVVNNKDVFSFEKLVNENLKAEYKTALSGNKEITNALLNKDKNAVEVVKNAVVKAGNDAANKKVTEVVVKAATALNDAKEEDKVDKKNELVKALEELVIASAKNAEKFEMKNVEKALLSEYAKELVGKTTVAEVKTVIETVNSSAVQNIMKDATAENILEKFSKNLLTNQNKRDIIKKKSG